jgi:transcription termination factor NusB
MVKENKVISISSMQTKLEIRELANKLGISQQEIKGINHKDAKVFLERFKKATHRIDSNRDIFFDEINPLLDKWSFEEVFVYTIDLLNLNLLRLCQNNNPNIKLEVSDLFPVLYDEIYNKCIEVLCYKCEENI